MGIWARVGTRESAQPPSPRTGSIDEMATELSKALAKGDLHLHYQPKFDLRTERAVSFEALARWRHATMGAVSPAAFIALSEQAGLVRQVSRWAMFEAFSQLRQWQQMGIGVSVSVNLSPQSLTTPEFPDDVRWAVAATDVNPHGIVFEVTEQTIMADFEQAARMLGDLHRIGPWIAVDDYGTGYSNLSLLRRLPVKELNIDRSVVAGIVVNNVDRSIVQSTIDLAHRLGVVTVAEGVENGDVLNALRELGCDQAQGYFLGVPVPPEVATGLLVRPTQTPEVPNYFLRG